MYESLRAWCKFPINIHVYTAFAGSGDATYAAAVSKNGYRVDETEVITDKYGKEYVSNSKVYFPSTVTVSDKDMIAFPEDVTTIREIHKIDRFYDGEDGKLSLSVVYL